MKKIYFMSGLPRSGSTLLANILAQNPRFHATSTSGVLDLISGIRNQWDNIIEFKATPNDEAKKRVMIGALHNFYADIEKPVIFDKCRGWLAWIEFLEDALDEKVKIIVPVRDMRDVLTSFEKLYRKNYMRQNTLEKDLYLQCQTVEGRCAMWLSFNNPLGIAYNRIQGAIQRGYRDRLHFVHFEKLTTNPSEEMSKIYKFLNEKEYKHDFNHVKQVTWEDDAAYGLGKLHDIRPVVTPVESQWRTILGEFAEEFGKLNFND